MTTTTGSDKTEERLKEIAELSDAAFFTELDVITKEDAKNLYRTNDRIAFAIKTYKEVVNTTSGEIFYVLKGHPININNQVVIVKWTVPKIKWDAMDMTKIYSGQVFNILNKETHTELLMINNYPVDAVYTSNNICVTTEMYNYEMFDPCCDVCNVPSSFLALSKFYLELEDGFQKKLLCSECQKHFKRA